MGWTCSFLPWTSASSFQVVNSRITRKLCRGVRGSGRLSRLPKFRWPLADTWSSGMHMIRPWRDIRMQILAKVKLGRYWILTRNGFSNPISFLHVWAPPFRLRGSMKHMAGIHEWISYRASIRELPLSCRNQRRYAPKKINFRFGSGNPRHADPFGVKVTCNQYTYSKCKIPSLFSGLKSYKKRELTR